MKKLYALFGFLLCFSITPNWTQAQSHDLVLKPNQSISPYYSLAEWIFSNANIPFDSYDLSTIDVLGEPSLSHNNEFPLVFIDGVLQATDVLGKRSFILPNLSFNAIDSITISRELYHQGYHTPSGAIHIYLKQKHSTIGYGKGLVNEINDPGPHISSELNSSNVEAINYIEKIDLWLPNSFKSTLLLSRDRYSRSNFYVYDDTRNATLFNRTLLRNNDGNSYLQRNVYNYIHLQNRFSLTTGSLSTFSTFRGIESNYIWDSIAGIETPFEQYHFQSGFQYRPNNTSHLKSFNTHFSWSDSDSLTGAPTPSQEIEQIGTHSAAHISLNTRNYIVGELKYQRWEDQINDQDLEIANWQVSWVHNEFTPSTKLTTMIGNARSSVGLTHDVQDRRFHLESSITNLNRQANLYTFWKHKIGYTLEGRQGQDVIDDSEHRNIRSSISYVQQRKIQKFQSSFTMSFTHYWRLSSAWTNYAPAASGRRLQTTTSFTDHQQVGLANIRYRIEGSLTDKLYTRTQLNAHLLTYSDREIESRFEQSPPISFNQVLQYKMHDNAQFELIYRYISARKINAYEELEAQSGWPPVRVRPIRLLNASAKTWMFDRALALQLALRNLLNKPESYNTNGQYYHMSIHVSAQLNIGKKNFR